MSKVPPAWILALAVLAASLPFVNQAFHIDDRIYLEVADNALKKPFFPYDYPPLFEGLYSPDAASHSHLPLTSYYLAAVKLLAGGDREWAFHLAFLIFPLIAVWSFYDLASRFVRRPLTAACLLLVSPSFLVLSHTLMTEVPLLAFWLLSISRFLNLLEGSSKRSDWLLCGLALLCAGFISLLSAGLVLLLATLLVAAPISKLQTPRSDGRGGSASGKWIRLCLLLSIPVVLWIVWYGAGYLHYGRFLLVRTVLHLDQRSAFSGWLFLEKLLSFVLNMGGAALFPAALWYGFRSGKTTALFVASFLLGAGGVVFWGEGWTPLHVLLFAFLFATGLTALLGFSREALATPDGGESSAAPRQQAAVAQTILPMLWFFGIMASYLLLYPSGSIRYSLLAIPPLILFWARAVERRNGRRRASSILWLSVALTAGWSLPVAHADYQFASLYRDAARDLAADYRRDGRDLWFTAEWGFRCYLQKEGLQIIGRTDVGPQPGDILIKPRLASPWVTLYDGDEYLKLLEQREARIGTPIRILDTTSHAGLYSTAWGVLPFSVTGGERWEWFNVFEVKKEYVGPIPDPGRHW